MTRHAQSTVKNNLGQMVRWGWIDNDQMKPPKGYGILAKGMGVIRDVNEK